MRDWKNTGCLRLRVLLISTGCLVTDNIKVTLCEMKLICNLPVVFELLADLELDIITKTLGMF